MIHIYEFYHPRITNKILGLDYDWTLVHPRGGKTFPRNKDDWTWMFSHVPETLKKYHDNGYTIIIFTNQSKSWKLDQLQESLSTLKIPLYIACAFSSSRNDKEHYKPNPTMFHQLVTSEYDKQESLFVGDALGRPSDFSDSDKVFAENIGIPYISPEQFFYKETQWIPPDIQLSVNKELIIMVGYPGSGKSTIAKYICDKDEKYKHISGDIYKTLPKIKQQMKLCITKDSSMIIDATNSSAKKRKEYISFVQDKGYDITCIHLETSREESYKRNKLRSDKKQVPLIAYSVYTKYFETPTPDEGFRLYII